MSVNNEMYKMYNEMVKGHKENRNELFEHGVRCWMDLKPENPFSPEEPAYEYFFLTQKGYNLWKMGLADRKINRRRMLENAHKLCECNPKKPYRFDKKAEEAELAAKAEAERKAAEEKVLAEKKAAEEKALAKKKAAEEKAEEERLAKLRKKEEARFNQEYNKHVLGIVPDESDIKASIQENSKDEDEIKEKKTTIFGRLFNKK